MWNDRLRAAVLPLLLATAVTGAAQAPAPAPQAKPATPPPAEAKPGAKALPAKPADKATPAKPKVKKAKAKPADDATVKPEVAGLSKLRSQAIKAKKTKALPESQRLNVNRATKAELLGLGLSEKAADKVIAGRPYMSKIQLPNRGVLSYAEYLSIKDKITLIK
ncbi:MAG TPA: hypothetical protein VJ570_10505 [Holophagaceae bacterium]|nr:hypothetical protein [Holophagaceae bacterium]